VNVAEFLRQAQSRVASVLVESDETFRFLVAALLVDGNVLLEGVPGTAKTLMARAIAHLLAADEGAVMGTVGAPARRFQRIQFTPDLMPSDIVGTNVFHQASATFSLRLGPIFANVVVADEINRAPAKTQSALLEAMEEHQVTIEGQTIALPPVFMVVATQNPVEFEGTYPLPEAQVDRFLFKLLLDHASAEAERAIVLLHHRGFLMRDLEAAGVAPLTDEQGMLDLRQQVDSVKVDDSVVGYMVAVERATRVAPEVQYGASVRGAIGLLKASKVFAAFAARDYVTPDDVKAVAAPVLRHRVLLRPEAELDGVRPDDVILRVLGNVAVPR
jgi:MoxR-like ATPase